MKRATLLLENGSRNLATRAGAGDCQSSSNVVVRGADVCLLSNSSGIMIDRFSDDCCADPPVGHSRGGGDPEAMPGELFFFAWWPVGVGGPKGVSHFAGDVIWAPGDAIPLTVALTFLEEGAGGGGEEEVVGDDLG